MLNDEPKPLDLSPCHIDFGSMDLPALLIELRSLSQLIQINEPVLRACHKDIATLRAGSSSFSKGPEQLDSPVCMAARGFLCPEDLLTTHPMARMQFPLGLE